MLNITSLWIYSLTSSMEIFPVASLEKIEESNQMLNCSNYLFLILFLIYNNDFQDVVSRETSYALQPVVTMKNIMLGFLNIFVMVLEVSAFTLMTWTILLEKQHFYQNFWDTWKSDRCVLLFIDITLNALPKLPLSLV